MKLLPRFHFSSLMKILMFTAHIYPENVRKYTSWNRVLEMFIYIKMDAESNETAPTIAFLRFHEDSEMFTKQQHQKGVAINTNRRVRKETRTDMESASLETLETTVDLTVLIVFDVRKSTKRDCSTTMLVTPPIHPLGQPQPWRRVLRTISLVSQRFAAVRLRNAYNSLGFL